MPEKPLGEAAARAIDFENLRQRSAEIAASFAAAQPFRHVVIDDFLHPGIAHLAERKFPAYETMQKRFAGLVESRAVERRFDRFEGTFARIFEDLRSPEFISWVETITGVPNLEPDATQTSGGLHLSRNGSYHNVHADQNRHPISGLFQRVNFLLYLNERWEKSWGGQLELWNADMSECARRIDPIFNRCVLMEVHDTAFHGVPPLRVPDATTRKSLTCWYFSEEASPLQRALAHDVLFTLRPHDPLRARLKHVLRTFVQIVRRAGRFKRKA